jgi:predicted  nucleic acid-binding Zn-ribbon protein
MPEERIFECVKCGHQWTVGPDEFHPTECPECGHNKMEEIAELAEVAEVSN